MGGEVVALRREVRAAQRVEALLRSRRRAPASRSAAPATPTCVMPAQQVERMGVSRARLARPEGRRMSDVTLNHPGGSLPLSVQRRHRGARRHRRRPSCWPTTGLVTLDPGFVNTAACASAITYIDGDAGILRYRGYPIEELAEKATLPRGGLAAHLRRAADRRRSSTGFKDEDPQAHDAARGLPRVLRRLPDRRAPDGGAVVGGQRAVDLLPGQPRPVRPRARRDVDGAAAGEDADHRGVRLQEVAWASRSCTRTTRSATSTTSCG